MKYLLTIVIILILLFFLLWKVQIRIVRRKKTDVDLYISKWFTWRIDLDAIWMQKMQNTFVQNKRDLQAALTSLKIANPMMRDVMGNTSIQKLTILPSVDFDGPSQMALRGVLYWQLLAFIKSYFDTNFKIMNDDYYSVRFLKAANDQKIWQFEIVLETRVASLLFIVFHNLTTVIKLSKNKERGVKDG